jgi:hypothetical protein
MNSEDEDSLIQTENADISTITTILSKVDPPSRLCLDLTFAKKLIGITREAQKAEYQFACLSTIGGAFAATKRSAAALQAAKMQEAVAVRIADPKLALRSRV